jgi:Ser/Thr protein kinase RdoA (MazF antagonist)
MINADQKILDILEKEYNFDLKTIITIKNIPSGINYVYQINTSHGKYILKEYIKLKSPQLDKVHSLLLDLRTEGIKIPTILKNLKDEYLTRFEGRNFDLTSYIEHVDLSDQVNISEKHLKLCATELAKIHTLSNKTKFISNLESVDFKQKAVKAIEDIKKFLKDFDSIIKSASNEEAHKLKILKELVDKTETFREQGINEFSKFLNLEYKPTHGDFSMVNNLINSDDNVFVIDWDNFALRPTIWDLQAAASLFSLNEIGNAYFMAPNITRMQTFIATYLENNKLPKDEILLLPEVLKYNFSIYWLSYTIPAMLKKDFRLLFLIPEELEKGTYWINNFQKYEEFIDQIAQRLY